MALILCSEHSHYESGADPVIHRSMMRIATDSIGAFHLSAAGGFGPQLPSQCRLQNRLQLLGKPVKS